MSDTTATKSAKGIFCKFSNLRIRTKLLAILALLVAVYLVILLTVVLSFQRIEDVLDGVISNDINNVMTNALTERELAAIDADLNLLLNTFFENETYLKHEGERLLEVSSFLTNEIPSGTLKDQLGAFIEEVKALLSQCGKVNAALSLVHEADTHIVLDFDRLDEIIADKLINATFVGDDISILQQLSVLVIGYRQSMLEIARLHAERWPEIYYSPLDPTVDPLLAAIHELDFRLRTLIASDSQIAGQGKDIIRRLHTYKKQLLGLNSSMVQLKKQKLLVGERKQRVFETLQQSDIDVVHAIEAAKNKSVETFRMTEGFLLVISLTLISVLVSLTYLFFKNIIKKPMNDICAGLEDFRHNNLNVRIDLQRRDEWLIIEEALNNMAAELSASYADLQKAQSFVNNIINSMPSVLVGVDSVGRVTQWNLRAEQITGISSEIARAQPLGKVYPTLKDDMGRIQAAIRNRQVVKDTKVPRADLPELYYEDVTIYPLITNGVAGAVIRVDDVTESVKQEEQKRQMQRQLEQTQRLESLGVLAGGIAHDFNNLLMGILGHADMALLKLPHTSSALENFESIKTISLRAADLCKQILAYSGQGKFDEQKFSMNDLVHEMMQMIKTSISKNCVLDLDLDEQLPLMIGDYSQMQQILMNFVINASDAFDNRSGIIKIATGNKYCSQDYFSENCIIKPENSGNYISLEVSDNGPGMDKDTLNRIFDPFFTTKFTGRGLGLSAVLGIVRSHGGGLRVDSTLLKGTTFTVFFPAVAGSAPEVPVLSEPKSAKEVHFSGKVLLVDDEEMVLNVCKSLLEVFGIDVLIARDGCEAVEVYKVKQDEIDLVILDLTMPKMDGTEAFRILRQFDPNAKIVIASGYAEETLATRFGGEKPSAILSKPYTLENLTNILSELLS